MNFFFCKLRPPRPSFANDLTPRERELLDAHAGYWTDQVAQRKCVAFGPVADPAEFFGAVILELAPGDDPRQVTNQDPVIRLGQGWRYEIHPMPGAVVRS